MAMTDKGDYLEFYERDPTDTLKEESHQIGAFQWLTYAYPELLAWHTKNEGDKGIATAMMDQQAGLVKGVSDFIILIGLKGRYPFAAIEMKRVNKSGKGKASPVSKEQKAFLRRVRELGGFAAVTYGYKQFIIAVEYMMK
ncbi:VRR-NUC domain-containing protein [Salmonella phage slyngel]|uniref:VRR-NUC domain-containing protein n=1 Tax=Salmonella phage slyngel TaxID=2713321 RepID=A0A6G8R9X6_9CAUD|nr:VRR-NUC domain-containing protein [Salmonella phage slyngel]QIN98187.1 VRR-NUC domain-containing protein [Salmonella phage slyngel]